jgi:hypothetical protein
MQRNDDTGRARFFGYGSLVNRATHDYPGAQAGSLTGWRRVWVHAATRPVAFLSVERSAGVTIAGLVAQVPGGDWAALDAREFAYDRQPVQVATGAGPQAAQVYAVPGGAPPTDGNPILLSYLDAVVQGFLREYGPEGAAGFFATTGGWQAPVRDDRADPGYPRAQVLTPAERQVVDAGLALVGARIIPPG